LTAAAFGATLWLGSVVGADIARGWNDLWHTLRGGQPPAAAATVATQYYTCGMHPWVILPRPGDCPICGMKLVPLDPAKFTGEVTINPVIAQDIGIRVSPVISGPVVRTIRTVGTVAYDETRLRDVNMKVGGWIEKLHVDSMGQPVKKGQPLFELYSPELYAAQEEYLLAWKSRNSAATGFVPDAAQSAKDLLSSARTKLDYFDITPQQIEELQKRGTPAKTMTIRSPHDGVVIAKQAVEGMKVDAGMQVYRIADLAKVWVMVTLYEYQLPYVQVGQSATMSLSYVPGEQFEGKVIYIYPYLSDKTRQVDVRLEFANPTGLLKPGMYATIDLHSTLAKDRTLVPRSAVIDTGERKVAFVSLGEGRFDPRNVQTGAEAQDGMVEILAGLKPGEKVVTSGQFLIDSEANVREALAKMIRGDLAVDQKPTVAAVGSSEVKALPDAAAKSLHAILGDYLAIQKKLAADSIAGIAEPANAIAKQVDELLKVNLPDDPQFWRKHEEVATVRGKALELAQATSLDQARLIFADLSISLDTLLKATGVPQGFGQEVQELHCPMYRQGQGGTIWLQTAGEVHNPYFGSAMPGCFDQRKALPVTGQAK
jgi:RND family efflux transporter MFP subunit